MELYELLAKVGHHKPRCAVAPLDGESGTWMKPLMSHV